ncbi:nucleoporin 98 [Pelomyxa schiedti]|nr:nucleoporin 98 [Pelomyxa schiedti]
MFNNIQVPQSPVAQVTQPQQQPQQQEPPTPYASLPRFNNLPKREDTATPRFHVSLSALSSPRSNSSPSQEEGGIHTTLYSAPTSPIRTQTFPLRPKKTPSSPETQNHPKVTVDEGLAKLTLSPKPKNDKETSLYIKPQQIESTKAEDQPQQPPPTPSQNYITPVRVDTLEGLQSNASTESPQGKGSDEVHEESAQSNSKEPPASPLPSNSEVRAKISSLKSHSSPLPSPQKSPSSNPRAPSLSKPGYSTIPHLNSLKGMSDEELSRVENFSVLCEGVGQVTFLGPTDLRNVDIDSAVQFGHMSLTVYPNNKYGSEPPVGQGLNKPAEVTLYNCFPASGRDVKRLVHYSRKIAETTERLGATLVDYNAMTGTWVFQVKHFSTYGIEWTSEDEREAGDEAADQEDREEPIDTDNIEEEKEELFLEVKDENESTEDTVQLDNTATHMESSEMQNITAFSQSSFSKTASLSTTTESTLPKETLHSKYTDEVPCSVFPPNVQALTEYIQSLGVSQSEKRYCVERDYPIVMPRVSWSPGGMFAIVTNSDYHLHLLSTSQVISLPPVEPCLKMLKSHLKSSGLSDPHDEMHGSQDMNESTSQKENMKTFTLYKDRLDEHISENSLNFPDGTPHKTLWELVKSLWGTIPEENSFDLQFSRRLALSKWLSRTLRMKKHTKLPSQNTTSGLLDEIFDLCSRNMISEAVQVAQQAKLNRLAVLIALSGGDPQRSRLLLEQQQGWLAGGKPAIVSDKIARLYKLLGGSTGDSDVERGMTWEQQFGFHMWFSTPPNRSTRSAIQNYVTTPTLIRPQSQTNKEYLDINYQLLALYAKGPEFVSNEESLSVDLLQALHPEGLVKCICDIQQTWFLQSVLCVLGYQMDILQYWRLYSWFACELGHWEWAIYVLLNIPQVSRETEWYLQKAIQKILDLHVAQGVNLPESLAGESSWADNFPYSEKLLAPKTLTEKLSFLHWLKCIPSQWLLRAEANSICTNDQDALLQKVNYLIQAEDFIEAHELLIAQVVPIVVVCGTKSYGDFKAETHLLAKLDDALQALSEHRHEIDQWGSGGSVVMEFMDLTSRMDPAELPNVPLDRYSTLLSKLKLWEDRVRIREGRELRLHCTPPLEGNLSQARLCVTILMTRTIKQLLRGRFSNNAEGASGGSTSRQEAISILSTLVNLPLPSDIRAKFHSHFSSIYTDTAYATFNNKNKV